MERVVARTTRCCDDALQQILGYEGGNAREAERISAAKFRYDVLRPSWKPNHSVCGGHDSLTFRTPIGQRERGCQGMTDRGQVYQIQRRISSRRDPAVLS